MPPALPVVASADPVEPFVVADTQDAACDSVEKPGAVSLSKFLLSLGGRWGGITRPCGKGHPSDHHRGSAFDWMLSASNLDESELAEATLDWLLASDAAGNLAANFRRAGLTYVIWNRKVWSSRTQTWMPYTGQNPHTDHIHLSLGADGAAGRTSFYTWLRGGALPPGPLPPPLPGELPLEVPVVAERSRWPLVVALGCGLAVGYAATRPTWTRRFARAMGRAR